MPMRQLTMQNRGATLQNYNVADQWQPLNASLVSSPMVAWRNTQKLDLRGLLAGDETGLGVSNAILQETGPVMLPVAVPEGGAMIIDMLTTVRPTDEVLSYCYRGTSLEATMPGFLHSEQLTGPTGPVDADTQSFSPSQVIWGLWRFFVKDRNLTSKGGASPSYVERVVSSGYFGEGETMVAPHVYWTRVVFGLASTTESNNYPVLVPSANLVLIAEALDLTTPQEVTAMMRGSGR